MNPEAEIHFEPGIDSGLHHIVLSGRLTQQTLPDLWPQADAMLNQSAGTALEVNAAGVSYCDISGSALMVHLEDQQLASGGTYELKNFPPEQAHWIDAYRKDQDGMDSGDTHERMHWVARIGQWANWIHRDIILQIQFLGQMLLVLGTALRHPKRVRWQDFWVTVERSGFQALPIVILIGFLLGLILAFQSAVPLRQFGADIWVSDLVALGMAREIAPLMVAILLAGRTASAFAAEIGTMTINEEVSALRTMGLDPVPFLTLPRVLGVTVVIPGLILYTTFAGLVGCGIVILLLGYPIEVYYAHIMDILAPVDVLGGLFKGIVFGIIIAGIGCLRGLNTGHGSDAVGVSTTRAVVSSIILLAIVDGIFAVVYYYLGI